MGQRKCRLGVNPPLIHLDEGGFRLYFISTAPTMRCYQSNEEAEFGHHRTNIRISDFRPGLSFQKRMPLTAVPE